ncbi:hypothetical protein BDI4_170015 [Burkholderia diffusa]|nr:hypothetical protein BDI4_170015 [Burkholderia diffusa]
MPPAAGMHGKSLQPAEGGLIPMRNPRPVHPDRFGEFALLSPLRSWGTTCRQKQTY